jgi:type VI secretion system secreted protein VgrG
LSSPYLDGFARADGESILRGRLDALCHDVLIALNARTGETEAANAIRRSSAMKSTAMSALVILTASACAHVQAHTDDILGAAASFGVLAGSTVTNTGATTVNGSVGVWPGSAVTGFPPGVVIRGTIRLADPLAQQAQADLTTAYNDMSLMQRTAEMTGTDLGGMTLQPGVYFFSSTAFLTGTLTLDGLGDPNAPFVFQVGSALNVANTSTVILVNGANAGNVYWQVGSSATLGTGAAFQGNILAMASITIQTGATIKPGRALARTGAVTLDFNTVTSSSCPVDFNGDGFLDFTNFDAFVTAFEAGASKADFDGDGFLDFTDFDAFVAAFEYGC